MTAIPRRSVIAGGLTYLAAAKGGLAAANDEETFEAPTASEDLMREHGVLSRLMLVYEAALTPPVADVVAVHEVLHAAASLVRRFIEDYHATLEERFVFPEFEQQSKLGDLVKTLREQHRIGRLLTDVILRNANADGLSNETIRAETVKACHEYVRMFRAHEAWEDTELFPAFKRLVTPARLRALGQEFEEIEHRVIGKDGFSETVRQVGRLEHHLGIHGLEAFTAPEKVRVGVTRDD